jgi:hypothetical protein
MNSKLGIGALSLLALSIMASPTFGKSSAKVNGGTTPEGKPFVYVGEQIEVIEAVQLSLQDQIDDLVGKVSTMEELLEATEDAIVLLQARDLALQALIESNAGNITDLQGEITRLNTELQQLYLDMANGDSTLQSQINNLRFLIGALQLAVSDLNTLQAQIDALETENSNLRLEMEAGDSSLQSQIDSNNTLITNLQGQIDSIGRLESQIDANKSLINALVGLVNSLSISIDRYASYMDRECPTGSFLHSTNADGSYVCEVDSGTGGIAGFRQLRATAQVVMNGNSHSSVVATCPTGSILTGGGYTSPTYRDVFIHESRPVADLGDPTVNTNGWYVSGYNYNEPNFVMSATALCLMPF